MAPEPTSPFFLRHPVCQCSDLPAGERLKVRVFAHNQLGLSRPATVILVARPEPALPASPAELLDLAQSEPGNQPVLGSTSLALIISSSFLIIILADFLAFKKYHKGLIHLH